MRVTSVTMWVKVCLFLVVVWYAAGVGALYTSSHLRHTRQVNENFAQPLGINVGQIIVPKPLECDESNCETRLLNGGCKKIVGCDIGGSDGPIFPF